MKNLTEQQIDLKLNITTTGTRSSSHKQHYAYEPTPYNDLFLLFKKIKLKSSDYFVDFGSGKGRVCFLVNYLFSSSVKGIEANAHTYGDALANLKNYQTKAKTNDKIAFHLGLAEKHIIAAQDNIFFFFNPFTVQIFKKVITNIISSVKENPRKITIILAYPIIEYVSYIIDHTNLIVKDYIEGTKNDHKFNKFLILSN